MKKQHIIATIISLLVMSGVIGLSACASVASAQPQGGIGAQVNTAVAATLAQYMIETEVATQAVAMGLAPAAQAQATSTPLPTATPLPTLPPQPTATAVPAQPTATPLPPPTAAPAVASTGPTIRADENTNCRVGPSTGYTIAGVFLRGAESTVQGRDVTKDWWYIVNSNAASGFCWVWDGSTTVKGDTSTLPVVDAPAKASYNANNLYYGYDGYNGYDWGFYGYGYNYNDCWDHPYNDYCWGSVNWSKYWSKNCGCKQTNPNKWWKCSPYYYNCSCKPIFNNYCKKSGCPPVTEVNYKNYCKKYPNCCDD